MPLRLTAWYRKTEATFSDVLAMVRRALWAEKYFRQSTVREEPILFHRDEWEVMLINWLSLPKMAKVEL